MDAYPDRTFVGEVLQIRKSPEITQNVVTYTAIVSAPNPDLLLFPGMTAVLRIVTSDSGVVLKIPNEALRFRPTPLQSKGTLTALNKPASAAGVSAIVWVIGGDGRPTSVPVNIGLNDGTGAQLLEGPLLEGQPLIVGVANSQSRNAVLGVRMGF